MLPHLREDDLDGAILAAMSGSTRWPRPRTRRGSNRAASSTPSIGLVGAPIVFAGLVGWAFFHWRRFGKDPVYLDVAVDLHPGPAARPDRGVGRDGHGRRHVAPGADDGDARPGASRGLIAFREETGILGSAEGRRRTRSGAGRRVVEAQRARNSPTADRVRRRQLALRGCASSARRGATTSSPRSCSSSAPPSTTSTPRSRSTSSASGWFAEAPSKVVERWVGPGRARDRRRRRLLFLARVQHPDERARPRRAGRRSPAGSSAGPGRLHARGDDARRDDPGAARRLPADAQEDHGAVALDGPGRRRRRARMARHARPGGRVGHGARPPGRDREGPRAEPR